MLCSMEAIQHTTLYFSFYIYLFWFCVQMFSLHVCMLLSATEDQKRAADPAALQGQMILSHHVYARN